MKERYDNDDYVESYETYRRPKYHGMVRVTAIVCFTLVVAAGMGLFYTHYNDRFNIMTNEHGIYVFDRKDASLNHCDTDANCKTVLLARNPVEAAKAVCESAVSQGQVAAASIGAGLLPFQGQASAPQPAGQASMMPPVNQIAPAPVMQPNQNMQTAITPSSILGQGIPKVAHATQMQNQMQGAQNVVNAGQMPMQQNQAMRATPPIVTPQMAPNPQVVVPPFAEQRSFAQGSLMGARPSISVGQAPQDQEMGMEEVTDTAGDFAPTTMMDEEAALDEITDEGSFDEVSDDAAAEDFGDE